MKSACLNIALVLIVLLPFESYSQYCIPDPTNGTDAGIYIDGVQLEEINNTGSGAPADTNYTFHQWGTHRANLIPATTYDLTLTNGTYYSNLHFVAWIDYNNDGDFYDANEKLGEFITTSGSQTFQIPFTTPSDLEYVKTRLRVRCVWNITDPDPCTDYGWGETEDYIVYINNFTKKELGFDAEYAGISFFNWDQDTDLDVFNYNSTFESSSIFLYYNVSGTFYKYDYLVSPAAPLIDLPQFVLEDFNNDNYLDYLLMGEDRSDNSPHTGLYLKSGSYHYYFESGIIELDWGCMAAADFNNDGTKDLIISGIDANEEYQTYVYQNYLDTMLQIETNLPGLYNGAIRCADYDADGDIDILFSGKDNYGRKRTEIYRNDNNWIFTNIFAQIPQVNTGIHEWGDYDCDGDMDIIMLTSEELHLYKLDSNGFTPITIFDNYVGAVVKWGDMNNDGLLDIFCEHENEIQIFVNNGDDTFEKEIFYIEQLATEFVYMDIGDYNNDQKLDILANADVLCIYENKCPSNNQKPIAPTNLSAVTERPKYYSVTLSWDAGSDDLTPTKALTYNLKIGTTPGGTDIMSPTSTGSTQFLARYGNVNSNTSWVINDLEPGIYYWSVQTVDNSFSVSPFSTEGSFEISTPLTTTPFYAYGRIFNVPSGFDYDLDNDMDILIDSSYNVRLFEQVTPLNFSSKVIADLNSAVAIGDLNTDNYPDILLSYNDTTEYLINNQDKSFSKYLLDTIAVSASTLADFDNDGDKDILIFNNGYYLYINNDSLNFERITLPIYDTMWKASLQSLDIENDGDIDFIISGSEGTFSFFGENPARTIVYRNDGNLNFSLHQYLYPELGSTQVYISGGSIGNFAPTITANDNNKDGFLDILLTGSDVYKNNYTLIYINDQSGNFFAEPIDMRPSAIHRPDWFDFNADGEIDIIIPKSKYDIESMIYFKEDDNYTAFMTNLDSVADIFYSAPIDIDNDNSKDFIYSRKIGHTIYHFETYLEKNSGKFINEPPLAPEQISSQIDSFTVRLSWSNGVDDLTGEDGNTYNIWVGTAPDNTDILSPLANINNGKGVYSKIGNCGTNNFYLLENLPVGKYYWAVQTIDNALIGGEWSEIDTFVISTINVDFHFNLACANKTTSFTDNTAVMGEDSITGYFWDFDDGSTSTEQNPQHIFTEGGTYMVKLTVYSALTVQTDSHEVVVNYIPIPNFEANPVCHNTTTDFIDQSNTSNVTVVSYLWNFGDTKTETDMGSTEHLYAQPGVYQASLSIQATNGCFNIVTKAVQVFENPDATISFSDGYSNTICEGGFTILRPLIENINYNYRWLYNNNFITGETSDSLLVSDAEGFYAIRVSDAVSGNLVCADISPSVEVSIVPKPDKPVLDSIGDNLCPFDPIVLTVLDSDTTYDYKWLRNGIRFSDDNTPYLEGVFTEAEYSVTSSINGQCEVTSEPISINYKSNLEIPELVVFGPVVWYIGCTNDKAVSYRWFYNGNLIPDETDHICMVNRDFGEYQLEITDEAGCTARSGYVEIPTDDYKTGTINLNETKIKVYPNPNDGEVFIEIESPYSGEVLIEIVDLNGITQQTLKLNKEEVLLKNKIILNIPAGSYSLKTVLGKQLFTNTIIVY